MASSGIAQTFYKIKMALNLDFTISADSKEAKKQFASFEKSLDSVF